MTRSPDRSTSQFTALIAYGVVFFGVLYTVAVFGTLAFIRWIGGADASSGFWSPIIFWIAYMAPQIYVPAIAVRLTNLFTRGQDRRVLFWTGIVLLTTATLILGIIGISTYGWRGILLLLVQLATAAVGMRLLAWACGSMGAGKQA